MKWLEFIRAAEACGITAQAEILAVSSDGEDALYELRVVAHSIVGLFILGADLTREVEVAIPAFEDYH
jgi:hypothetical protein